MASTAKGKKEIPAWSFAAAVALVVVVVAALYLRAAPGEASKEELSQIRGNQQKMSGGSPLDSPLAPPH